MDTLHILSAQASIYHQELQIKIEALQTQTCICEFGTAHNRVEKLEAYLVCSGSQA